MMGGQGILSKFLGFQLPKGRRKIGNIARLLDFVPVSSQKYRRMTKTLWFISG
jgi:hypothetical protein